ncbi:M20 family metallopeptidase [Patescibacteria group bacterium]|nr:M20 family metallopeptidase [Patescibacteria group bacterium]
MHIDKSRIVEITKELIKYKSLTGMEKGVGDYISGFFDKIGVEYRVFEKEKGRPNIIANLGSGEKTLAFNGHFDVVPISDESSWKTDPFSPELKGNRLFGRGAFDMKGSCAVMMHIAEILSKKKLNGSLQIQLVSDEEKGAEFGTRHIIELIEKGEIKRPDHVIIGEGSDLKIRNGERGILVFDVKFKGKAAHTANVRSDAINAIVLASKAVLAIDKKIDKFHPEIGTPVISVNMISGGKVKNQVPGECVITVDRRTIPGETKEKVLEEIKQQIDKVLENESYEILNVLYGPANITSKDSPFIKLVAETIMDVLKIKPEFYIGEGGVTDARFYRYAGIPTIIYGPLGEHAHGPNEYVDVDSLEKQAKVYLGMVNRTMGSGLI